MYLFRCATCEAIRVEETLVDAQAAFNEHAIEQHETEITRIEDSPATEPPPSMSGVSAGGPDLEEPEKEGCDYR